MVDRDIVARKIAGAQARLSDLERQVSKAEGIFLGQRETRDLAAFYLLQTVQECVDLASHWIVDEGLEPGDDAGSSFGILATHQEIPQDLADVLRGAVGLRNLIAHGYGAIDHARLREEARKGIPEIRRFLRLMTDAVGLGEE